MSKKLIHVAAAVIRNESGQILIARRSDDQHQGGLWEFPGGKVEPGEPVGKALYRELFEELGIEVISSRPLIQIPHHYSDKSVLLDVFEVSSFSGDAFGKEGQPIKWVTNAELEDYDFPEANKPIVDACLLPALLAITPFDIELDELLPFVKKAKAIGAQGVVIRLAGLTDQSFVSDVVKRSVRALLECCEAEGIFVTANTSVAVANELGCDAVHLTAQRLHELPEREAFAGRWLSASCHDQAQIELSQRKGCDFVFLSPVKHTSSHPNTHPMGWSAFETVVSNVTVPVYALGGLGIGDYSEAACRGAQGVAAISAWLEG